MTPHPPPVLPIHAGRSPRLGRQWRGIAVRAALAWLLAGPAAQAQTLGDALESAWQRQPMARAQAFRSAEWAARAKLAGAWLPAPPSIGVCGRSDRLNRRAGAQEVEAGLSLPLPLRLPGQRARDAALAGAEGALLREAADGAR